MLASFLNIQAPGSDTCTHARTDTCTHQLKRAATPSAKPAAAATPAVAATPAKPAKPAKSAAAAKPAKPAKSAKPSKPLGSRPPSRPKKANAPEHTQAWVEGGAEYAKFEPLPPETNVPRPAESFGQPWHPLDGCEPAEDDVASWNGEDAWEREEDGAEDDAEDAISDILEYEPDSLDTVATATVSLSSSYDDATDVTLRSLFTRKSSSLSHTFAPHQAVPVYAGPSLLLEDDSFDDSFDGEFDGE